MPKKNTDVLIKFQMRLQCIANRISQEMTSTLDASGRDLLQTIADKLAHIN